MRKCTLFILIWVFALSSQAQRKAEHAPLNPAFLKYMEMKRDGRIKTSVSGERAPGYIPSPLFLNFKEHPARRNLKNAGFPDTLDLRQENLVTPVKYQGTGKYGGNCVAFATMGTLESRWLTMGLPVYDLSEENIASCYGYEWGYGEGANQEMATAYLSRLSGPILENQNQYDFGSNQHPCIDSIPPVAYVPEARWLPFDEGLVKQYLMDFGGMYITMHYASESFRSSDNTYLYTGTESGNHAVLLAGWNDNKYTTGGRGVWIAKNSWDTDFADEGYFYIGYQDTRALNNIACYPVRMDLKDIDTLYMYDWLGSVSSVGYRQPVGYGLVKFESPEEQQITKIGTFTVSEGTIIDIEVYDDFQNDTLSGLLASLYNRYIEFPGYYTFDLPFKGNGDYYIKVKYNTPGFHFPIPVETKIADYADPVIEEGVNWISSTGNNWFSTDPDTAENETGENLCIRAYALRSGGPRALFSSDKKKACLESTVTYTYLDDDPVTTFSWEFGEGASPGSASTPGPHHVRYSSLGTKTVSLKVYGPEGADSIFRKDYIRIVPEIEVIIPDSAIFTPVGREVEIMAFGADTYIWSPADFLDTTKGSTVHAVIDTEREMTYTVTGVQGNCSASDSVIVIASANPDNDDVCDAFELKLGGWYGMYTNINATVQDNEPAPPEGECNEPLQWCEEGGLQNSVWFTFTGPESGKATFTTGGFDTQLAIYETENDTCTDILEDKYTLIAANDDYFSESQQYAAAIDMADVTPGKPYWLQLDGSAGGDEGYFHIIFWDAPVGTENQEMDIHRNLEIFPNPSPGNFRLNYINPCQGQIAIEIYNINGQQVFTRDYGRVREIRTRIDLSGEAAGVYLIRLINASEVIHRKIIIR